MRPLEMVHSQSVITEARGTHLPLASCIMPTAHRPALARLAVDYFMRQDYLKRELIIVDDDRSLEDSLPSDERIHYIHLGQRRTVGYKRNRACEVARGEVILHWDDDDWMADWRISYQVGRLLESGAGACGLSRLLYYEPARSRAWLYRYPSHNAAWVSGNTLCFKRKLWSRHPFADRDVGEDTGFVNRVRGQGIVALEDHAFYVATVHQGNVSPKRTAGRRWHAVPVDTIEQVMGREDYARVHALMSLQDPMTVMGKSRGCALDETSEGVTRLKEAQTGATQAQGHRRVGRKLLAGKRAERPVGSERAVIRSHASGAPGGSGPSVRVEAAQGRWPASTEPTRLRDPRARKRSSRLRVPPAHPGQHADKQAQRARLPALESATPLVSCIMPTAGRREFVAQSFHYFRRQTYENLELVVVDDGEDSVQDLFKGHERVRYLRLTGARSIGEKRNIAVQSSRGDVILHWDDDDWYGPGRVRRQLEPILAGEADICGLEGVLFLELSSATFWSCQRSVFGSLFYRGVHGGSLAYRKELWGGRAVYPDVSLAEDAGFLSRALRRGTLGKISAAGILVYVRHGDSAWQFRCGSAIDRRRWTRVTPPEFVPETDLVFYGGWSAPVENDTVTCLEPSSTEDGHRSEKQRPVLERRHEGTSPQRISVARIRGARGSLTVIRCGEPSSTRGERGGRREPSRGGSSTKRGRGRLRRNPDELNRRRQRRALAARYRTGPPATQRVAARSGEKVRLIFDARKLLLGDVAPVRREGDAPCGDPAVDEAYEHTGVVLDFFREVFGRQSIDRKKLSLNCIVHYGRNLHNAYWDGHQLVHGDGGDHLPVERRLYRRFTCSLGTIAHELTHAVVQSEARLVYRGQSGALNESFCDVMASLVKQWHFKQTVEQADWELGGALLTERASGRALRSLKAPGTAFSDSRLGEDMQVAHMDQYRKVSMRIDHGGVHANSGIPNHAFYLTACALGGYAWERAGLIWYRALTTSLSANATFLDAATVTHRIAAALFGAGSPEEHAVLHGWISTGVYSP